MCGSVYLCVGYVFVLVGGGVVKIAGIFYKPTAIPFGRTENTYAEGHVVEEEEREGEGGRVRGQSHRDRDRRDEMRQSEKTKHTAI